MTKLKLLLAVPCTVFLVAFLNLNVLGQTTDDKGKLASIAASGSSVKWDVAAPYSELTITVSAPDGRVFRRELKSGATVEFPLTDKRGEKLPDGEYSYELRLAPVVTAATKESRLAARGKDDEEEDERSARKRAPADETMVQSGTFSIVKGAAVVAGGIEETDRRRTNRPIERPRIPGATGAALLKIRQHHLSAAAMPDQVIPDDLIVQGSECVGLDCVNNEVFNFDTIKLKENNLRIKFEDTSVGSFPTNDWQLTANDSASGGQAKFSIDDVTGAKTPFTVEAGASTNSIYVDSTGRVGFRTSTPVLDLHANTSNTPGLRLEQNNSIGFGAQIWDVAGNEANFFVRDVTGGSRLPFRIRPGAPTSSIDIDASGDIGIGTATPALVSGSSSRFVEIAGTSNPGIAIRNTTGTQQYFLYVGSTGNNLLNIYDATAGADRIAVNTAGRVGIGTTTMTETLTVNGTASKPGGGTWSIPSDERLKNIKGRFDSGLQAVMQLQPLRFTYRPDNALGLLSKEEYVGFGAQAVQKVIPEAVTKNETGYLMLNSDPILWTMVNAIKEQQQEIAELKKQVRQLRMASRRRK